LWPREHGIAGTIEMEIKIRMIKIKFD